MENTAYILNFLKQLSQNNNREWFTENKPQYQQAHEYFISLVELVISELAKTERKWKDWIPKNVFSVSTEIPDFQKIKHLIKQILEPLFWDKAKELVKLDTICILSLVNLLLLPGLYQPNSDVLKKFRKEISYNKEEFLSIIENPTFKKILK